MRRISQTAAGVVLFRNGGSERRYLLMRSALTRRPIWEFPKGGVESGETEEQAAVRELWEEAGLKVRNVRYVTSQPWPFPSSLMMACVAETDDPTIELDRDELEDAFWIDRAGLEAAMAGAPDRAFIPPPHYAIAHTLLRWWLDN